jgi:hypothetical protein
LLVFSLRNLPDELKPASTLLTLDSVWLRWPISLRRPRCVVDEGWLLMQQPAWRGVVVAHG